jgi:hypothetical protein
MLSCCGQRLYVFYFFLLSHIYTDVTKLFENLEDIKIRGSFQRRNPVLCQYIAAQYMTLITFDLTLLFRNSYYWLWLRQKLFYYTRCFKYDQD